MKTVGIISLLAGGLLYLMPQNGVAAASGVHQPAHTTTSQMLEQAHGATTSGTTPHGGEGVIAEPMNATLQIPGSAFTPGIVDTNGDHPESYTEALRDFSPFYALPQTQSCNAQCLDYTGPGWFQRATFGPLTFEYLGSTFDTKDAVVQAIRYELEKTSLSDTPSNCGNVYHTMCYTTEFSVYPKDSATPTPGATPTPTATPDPAKTLHSMFTMLQYNNCLVEATVSGPSNLFDARRDLEITTLASMVRAGYVQAEQVCPQRQASSLDFSIVQVRAEKQVAGAAFNLSHPGLQSWPVNQTVNLAIYFYVRSLLPKSKAIAEFTVVRGMGVHFFFQSGQLSLTKAPDTYRITVPYVPRYAGNDLILGRVSINGVSVQSATTLHVTGKTGVVKGAASQPPATSKSGAARPPLKAPASTPVHNATNHAYNAIAATFALPLSLFPSGSRLLQSQVASNNVASWLSIPSVDARAPVNAGRLTGYTMNTVQPNGRHAVQTQYVVSLYRSKDAAAAVFARRLAAYKGLHHASPALYYALQPPIHVGTQPAMGLALTKKSGKYFETVEIFFVRGDVLVQVAQRYASADTKPYGSRAGMYLTSLASRLDQLAQIHG